MKKNQLNLANEKKNQLNPANEKMNRTKHEIKLKHRMELQERNLRHD